MTTTRCSSLLGASTAAVLIGGLILITRPASSPVAAQRGPCPVQALIEGLESARAGNFDQEIVSTGATELMRVVEGFNAMSTSLRESRVTAERREQHMHDQSARLRSILKWSARSAAA